MAPIKKKASPRRKPDTAAQARAAREANRDEAMKVVEILHGLGYALVNVQDMMHSSEPGNHYCFVKFSPSTIQHDELVHLLRVLEEAGAELQYDGRSDSTPYFRVWCNRG